MNAVDTGWINDENPLEKAFNIAQVPSSIDSSECVTIYRCFWIIYYH